MNQYLLIGAQIQLRALEPEDLKFLFTIENNEAFWAISHTQAPFSKFLLKQYLENAHLDIYEAKQLRLVIANKNTQEAMGLIDLFDFNPKHKRAGIGILLEPAFQNQGFASDALSVLIKYAFQYLDVHQLYANITEENSKSLRLFEKLHFKKVGVKKDWLFKNNSYQNEILYQLIKA